MTDDTNIWMGVVDPEGKKIPPIKCEQPINGYRMRMYDGSVWEDFDAYELNTED